MGTGGKTPPAFEDPPQLFFFIIIIFLHVYLCFGKYGGELSYL